MLSASSKAICVLIGATCVATMTACSSKGGDHRAPDSATASNSSVHTGASQESIVQHPIPNRVPNKPAARSAAHVDSCAGSKGQWKASGTVSNPSGAAHTYTITILFTTPHATVLDYAQTRVPVMAHASRKWVAAAKFETVTDTRCVLRGVA